MSQLIEMDNQRGFKSAWIDLEQIFDLFSGGQFSPFGLRNFLGWVEKNWADPQPFSVLLAGDSTWDYWDRFALNGKVPNWTPSSTQTSIPISRMTCGSSRGPPMTVSGTGS
ncbi:MAG: hypothetical protein IPI28_17900 [Candidatus Omnitrophica bacterium]|nr:hypothetical protein [Candidatus Omnitrophota bacterium]